MTKDNISGITKIAVKGFKSIAEECAIDIRPLTILAGANSSGKSSIMQPLLMLKQTLEAPYDPGPLKIDGPNVKFTEAEQFFSIFPDHEKTNCFQIRIETNEPDFFESVETTFKKSVNVIEIDNMKIEQKSATDPFPHPIRFSLRPKMSSEEIKSILIKLKIIGNYDIVKHSRCFLHLQSQHDKRLHNLTQNLENIVLNSIHVIGLTGNRERLYQQTYALPPYPGTFEYYVASLIHRWQSLNEKQLKKVTDSLQTLELTSKISTQKIGDVGIEVQVGRLTHSSTNETDMVNIADVGFGVSQVLPVLVALIAAEPGQLVYLEQPELHLHPRAQVALATVLADAARRGVRVVAETHSSLLLLGVQTLVAEGKLSPDLVKLHWFSRNDDGITQVSSAELDDAGTYGNWPEDFDDVDLNAQSRYLDAVDKLRFGKE